MIFTMQYKELIKEINVAKDRTHVYQLLAKQGIEVGGLGRSLSRLISKAVQDRDLILGQVLRAAQARVTQLVNIKLKNQLYLI